MDTAALLATVTAAPRTVREAKDRLREKVNELSTADPARTRTIAVEIQQLRIAMYLLQELETGTPNPDIYKELSLLTRMTTGKGLNEVPSEEPLDEDRERLLADRGLDPVAASRIARVLASVMERGDYGSLQPDDAE